MCGICGFTWRDDARLQRMISALEHRGPDESGAYVDEQVSIGHTRLSVIDLTAAGSQPMQSSDGRYRVAYNGEIYNFRELRSSLEERGHRFEGSSDTEVLVAGYAEWGDDVFEKLNGMWAVAVYDREERVMVLCRDKLGQKPLYYGVCDLGLFFASEMNAALMCVGSVVVSSAAVDFLLACQFVPSPLSVFEGIEKVEPRQVIRYRLESGLLERRYYYDIPQFSPVQSRGALVEEGRELFRDAVRIRMVSDVPLGAFLSGGLDSSAVVGAMREVVAGDLLHTVSAGFDLPGLDESEYIRMAADRYSTVHHHVNYRCDQVGDDLVRVCRHYAEPVLDASSLPTFRVSEEARKWMTVALSGDGGDELFGGYDSRQLIRKFMTLCRLPLIGRKLLHSVLSATVPDRDSGVGRIAEALRVSLRQREEFFGEIGASFIYRPSVYKDWTRKLFSELLELANGDLLEAVLKFDLHYNRLGDNYCAKVDRMSMAHSLEVRSPFLDYRFIEFASRVPVEWKLDTKHTKILLREIASDLVPGPILNRSKHGFAAPLGVWADENLDLLRAGVRNMLSAGALDSQWESFLMDRVLCKDGPVEREYRKRLALLVTWYSEWGCRS